MHLPSLSRGLLAALTLIASSVEAYELPTVNLGATSFLDGAPPPGAGWYANEYLQLYAKAVLKDADGDALRLPTSSGPKRAEVTARVALTQIVYNSDQPLLFGGKWGLSVIVPVVDLSLNPNPNLALSHNAGSLGDLVVGPYLQWDPILGDQGPVFAHRIELSMILPTGSYDPDDAANPGSNVFSFNPYWAATAFLTPKWTLSWRLHYLWSASNTDPYVGFGANDTQAGQAIHLNFATAYEVIPSRLRLGINGYYLKQITDSRIDGHEMRKSKEEVLGIGPGLVYHLSPADSVFFNTYWETGAVNRSEGTRFNLRLVHRF